MSFYDTAWAIATMVSRRSYEEMRLLVDDRVPYPHISYVGRPVKEYVLHIPLPDRLVPFDLRENLIVKWRVFKACVAHEAGHAYLTDPLIYEPWRYGKDDKLSSFTINLIEDYRVESFLALKWAGLGGDVALANAVAYLRFHPLDRFDDELKRIMAATASKVFIGAIKGNPSKEEKRTIEEISRILDGVKWTNKPKALISAAERIYGELSRYGQPDALQSYPVIPHHDGRYSSVFFSSTILNDDGDADKVLREALSKLSLGDLAEKIFGSEANSEANYVFHNEELRRRRDEETLKLYQRDKLNFLSIGFPKSDYSEYLRVKRRVNKVIRSILSTLAMVKTDYEEEPHQRAGLIDLHEAVQAVASESSRSDIFKQLERSASSSAWAILIDASESLLASKDTLKEVSVCLAEVANGLMPQYSWGLYVFSDVLMILKDFEERYDRRVKSRLGNLMVGGATYLPDALEVASKRILKLPQSYKVIVVVTDGQPHGYENIVEETEKTVKEVEKSGVTLIAIGVRSAKPKRYFRNFCYVNSFEDLARNFVRLYYSITQWF